VTGWTSWYHYYEAVTEKDIMDNLAAMQAHHYPIDYFQIDDGYQQMVGDWLDINSKFPSGMPAITKRIRSAGYTPGLWLAPFSAQFKSDLVAQHPEWVVRKPDNQSEYLVAGKPKVLTQNVLLANISFTITRRQDQIGVVFTLLIFTTKNLEPI
jgi:alpha-galactosidase